MLDRTNVINKISEISKKYSGIFDLVILFGSVARNEMTESSDIDLYIQSSLTTGKLGRNKDFINFQKELYFLFSDTEIDWIYVGGIRDVKSIRRSTLWVQIEKDGVVLFSKIEIQNNY